MNEKPLTLDEMFKLAERVPLNKWNRSREVTDFGNLSPEVLNFLDVPMTISWLFNPHMASWEHEGEANGLKVLLDYSSRDSNFYTYLQIAVLNNGEFIGCSRRLKESKAPNLYSLYERIRKEIITREKLQGESRRTNLTNQGLSVARSLL